MANALEASESLSALRDTVFSHILMGEAKQRGVSLESLVQELIGQSSQVAK